MKVRVGLTMMAVTLAVMAGFVMVLAQPSLAAPGAQGRILPSPTWVPVDDAALAYTVEQVGGEDKTLTFHHEAVDGFTLGETTVHSAFPDGMFFTLDIQDSDAAIDTVLLFITFPSNRMTRGSADYNPESGLWEVHLWPTPDNRPPAWVQIEFSWRVRDVNGTQIETAPIPTEYWDPAKRWWKVDNAYTLVFWRGFSDEDPDYFASHLTEKLAAMHELKLAGFGRDLSYKPIGVIYGSREEWAATKGGVSNPSAGGSTFDSWGTTEMFTPAYSSDNTIRATDWLSGAVGHELTHLYQFDLIGSTQPIWWADGQADYFAAMDGSLGYLVDERLMNLAQLQDLPTISTDVSRNLDMADGRRYFSYDAGLSFVNWLVNTYGIETHRAIAEQMMLGAPLYEAFEIVFGRPFVEVENEWRAYLGEEPVDPVVLDPTLALKPYEDPLLAVGDKVTMPAVPPITNVFETPGPNEIASGPCFANTEIEILRMGTLDGVPYFEVNCMGIMGWMSRDQIVGG